MSLAQGITLKPMKGSELMAVAALHSPAADAGRYVPPSLRKAEAAKPKPIDMNDRTLFPTLGSVAVAEVQPQKEPMFKKVIEKRIQQDIEEEILGKRSKNRNIHTMTRAQLEEIGFEVLRLPNLSDHVKREAFLENLSKHREELDERYAKFQEGIHVYGEHDGFTFSCPLIPHEVLEDSRPILTPSPVWGARPDIAQEDDDDGVEYVEDDDSYDE